LIDWWGPDPVGGPTNTGGAIVVSRPPVLAGVIVAGAQLGFPAAVPAQLPEGVNLWLLDPTLQLFLFFPGTSSPTAGFGEPFWWAVPPLPGGGGPGSVISVQIMFVFAAPIAGGGFGPVCPAGGTSQFLATPAMWIDF
jgi:hypothetical protein